MSAIITKKSSTIYLTSINKPIKYYVMNNTGKILTAIAAGATAGAILGILFAPDRGSETRKKIADQRDRISGNVKNTFRRGKERLTDIKDDVEKNVRDRVEEFA